MKKHLLAEVFIRNWIKYKIWPTIGSGRRRWVYKQVMLATHSMLPFANNYTLHWERRAFSYVSQFPLEGFSWKIVSVIFHACATRIARFVPIGRLINGTLLSEHGNWSDVSRLPLEGFSWNAIPRMRYEHCKCSCYRSKTTILCLVFARWRIYRSRLSGLLGVVKWRGVGVYSYLFGTSIWQGLLYLQKRKEDTRPNMTLH